MNQNVPTIDTVRAKLAKATTHPRSACLTEEELQLLPALDQYKIREARKRAARRKERTVNPARKENT